MLNSERRQFPRLSFSVYVDYEVMGRLDNALISTHSQDLSLGGIRLILKDRFKKGTVLKLTFLLPGEKKLITATGQIAWEEEIASDNKKIEKIYDAGLQFVYLDPSDRKLIQEYLSKKSSL